MTPALGAFVAHARTVSAADRAAIANGVPRSSLSGALLVETCHRFEVIGPARSVDAVAAVVGRPGAEILDGPATVRHLVRLAVGLESAIVGEDQILHQLRAAARDARARGGLDVALDHLTDLALRAGRRARTWLPAQRPTLADVALDVVAAAGRDRVLVVGAGSMGRLAAVAARRRGHEVVIASRTRARAERLAQAVGGRAVDLDPGPPIVRVPAGIVVALSGPWTLSAETSEALVASDAAVIDLSSPPSIAAELAARLGRRHRSIDDLASPVAAGDDLLRERLERLVADTVAVFEAWTAAEADRSLARALADRAADARTVELDALWRRMPDLDPAARAEIERMATDLTSRLLRDPLERLGDDVDGRHGRAAQELFRL